MIFIQCLSYLIIIFSLSKYNHRFLSRYISGGANGEETYDSEDEDESYEDMDYSDDQDDDEIEEERGGGGLYRETDADDSNLDGGNMSNESCEVEGDDEQIPDW